MSDLDLSLTVRRGHRFTLQARLSLPGEGITAIVGGSGGGKTTLLRAVAGLETDVEGHLSLGGRVWLDSVRGINLPVQHRRVGVVFQDYALFGHMSIAQNVAFAMTNRSPEALQAYLQGFDLVELAGEYPANLSGGQRQRVALARALAANPELLLLDEPFSAVDVPLRARLRDDLWGLIRRRAIPTLLITHDMHDVRALADWVVVLDEGRVIRSGPTNLVLSRPRTVRAARILGWDNLLPITHGLNHLASGPWGGLTLSRPAPVGTVCLGILPDRIKVAHQPGGNNLEANLEMISRAPGGIELICRLTDGTRLRLLQPMEEAIPLPGPVWLHLPGKHLHCLGESRPLVDPDSLAKSIPEPSRFTPVNEEAA